VGNGAPANLSASFNAVATASQAARAAKHAGDGQTATAGGAVGVLPSVRVFDANDNPVAGVPVAFAVASGGGTVAPVTPVSTNADGIAAVSSWTLGPVAGANSLTATVAGSSVSGSPLTFQATGVVGSANRLVFSAQPVNAAVGATIDPAVEVQVQDAAGNVITSADRQVTITLGNNPSGAALSGQTTVSAEDGVARFTNLRLSLPGTGYTLRALASGLSDATSTAFDVVNGASRTRITDISPSTTVVGQQYRVDFSVTAAPPASGTPSGTVTVTDGDGATCQASVGAGSCFLTSTRRGTKQIVATYAGDASFGGSASDPEDHSVNAAGTTIQIQQISPEPSLFGQPFTVRVAVTVNSPGGGQLDGTVGIAFQGGGNCTVPITAVPLECSITPAAAGIDRDVTAEYTSASGNFQGDSDLEEHTVSAVPTNTALTASPNPSNVGQTVQLTAVVSADGGGVPGGQVRFRDGGNAIGQLRPLVGGTATLSHAFQSGGEHDVTAEYLGEGGFAGSTSPVVEQNVNSPPDADDDSYATDEDVTLNVGAANGVLDNDNDPEGSALSAQLVSGPSNAQSFSLNNDGSFSYTPSANFSGQDSFTYRTSDGSLASAPATVRITVQPVNDPPVGVGDSYATQGTQLQVNATQGVLANDADPEGATLSAELLDGPDHELVFNFNGDGSFEYTPDLGFDGTDSFTYRADDGSLESEPVTVTITVTP
jgi:hypothetical protein